MADIFAILQEESIQQQFWSHVDKRGEQECWFWKTGSNPKYYAVVHLGEVRTSGHRAAYQIAHGQIPNGMVIDHLCRNRRCVNPAHLEAVTSGENTRRGLGGMHRRIERASVTHCNNGHPFSEENTKRRRPNVRECKICLGVWDRNYKRRKRELAQAIRETPHDK